MKKNTKATAQLHKNDDALKKQKNKNLQEPKGRFKFKIKKIFHYVARFHKRIYFHFISYLFFGLGAYTHASSKRFQYRNRTISIQQVTGETA